MSNIIFGPVTSRRFGQSLGIDLSPEKKQCNFDCLYCELKGAKVVETIKNPPSVEEVVTELKIALQKHKSLDFITLTANGEPTLYPYLNELIDEIDKIKGDIKTLILSNGANIVYENIQEILQKIDVVKLSLDAATKKSFKKIDRPLKSIDVIQIINSMSQFRKKYKKELILEVLVVKSINDTSEEFLALKEAIEHINPDRIDIGTIDRPPAYDVQGVSMEKLQELVTYLGDLPVSIAYKRNYTNELRDFSKEEILKLIEKRPQSFEDVRVSFSDRSRQNLEDLLARNLLHVKEIAGVKFYKIKEE